MKKALKRIESNITNINHTLDKQAISIDHHIKRTDALEEIVIRNNRKMTLAEGALMLLGLLGTIIVVAKVLMKAAGYG